MKVILIIAAVIVATVFIIFNSTGPARETLVKIGETQIKAEIADTPAKLGQGLSGRASLPPDQGLLFIFDTPDRWGIWMKEMKFPLDIIWLNEQKRVVYIEQNVSPETYPKVFTPPVPAKYVLEVGAGFSQTNQVKINSQARF